MVALVSILIIPFVCVRTVLSANILGVFVIPAVSHQSVFHPILRELSLRGHQVTAITPIPLNDPTLTNLTEIDVGFVRELFHKLSDPYYLETRNMSPWFFGAFYSLSLSWFIQAELDHPSVQGLINDGSKKFDLVLVEFLHPLPLAFGAKFNCPTVGLLSQYANINQHFALGNPSHPIASPETGLRHGNDPLSFFGRVESVLYSFFLYCLHQFITLPLEQIVARRYFGDNLPYLGDLERNLSALLINVHPLTHGVRPNVPNVIEIAKVERIRTHRTVSEELLTFLDSAEEGVVYFSLGSLMKTSSLGSELTNAIKAVFAELPQKVLLKWDGDIDGLSGNVKTVKWVPQVEVLQHPNIRAFVTQGGPQSIEEALSAGVPVLAMPLQFDQFSLSKRVESHGIGRQLDIDDLRRDNFKEALVDVINNPRYKENVQRLNVLIEDRPMSGLDTAIWWIEYVIRNGGTEHIRSPMLDLPLYQYYFLDIAAVALITIFVLFKITHSIFKCLYSFRKYKSD